MVLKRCQAIRCSVIDGIARDTARWTIGFCGDKVRSLVLIFGPGDRSVVTEKSGHHGVGIDIKESLLEETEQEDIADECFSD